MPPVNFLCYSPQNSFKNEFTELNMSQANLAHIALKISYFDSRAVIEYLPRYVCTKIKLSGI